MAKDKYTALWVSYSSISDFQQCPRAYYLKHIYRDKQTNHKIKIISPPLALGSVIHEILDQISYLPKDERFKRPLIEKLQNAWSKYQGLKGGFLDSKVENIYYKRAEQMLIKLTKKPGPLLHEAVKIKSSLPYFFLSEKDNIILCGKIDWLEYLKDLDSVHIIDFKTSMHEESLDSIQLPIYYLLVSNCQSKNVSKASYWYLEQDSKIVEVALPNPQDAHFKILKLSKEILLARKLELFKCRAGDKGCNACRNYEAVLIGNARYVGIDEFGYDLYILHQELNNHTNSVEIL